MYSHILVAIEHSGADDAVLEHVETLAKLTGAKLLLVHVADGWAARHFHELELRESEEMRQDREYLERLCQDLTARAAGAGRSGDATGEGRCRGEGGPDRDVDARSPLSRRPAQRQHRGSGEAQCQSASVDGEGVSAWAHC